MLQDQNSINPSTGLFARNPTRIGVTENSENQQDIVNAIKGVKQKIIRKIYDYSAIDRTDPPPLAGITKIREMTEDQKQGFFRTLMRYKPNIVKLHISLGDYKNKKRASNNRINLLNSNKQRFHTEVAEKMADVFSDPTINVVEVIYTVTLTTNTISTYAEVFTVAKEDYDNDEFFSPAIGIEYMSKD